jgi:hypothetical protein
VCPNKDSPAIGVWLRSMTGRNAPPAVINCISGEGDVGTPRRERASGWGGGSCVEDRASEAGHCQTATTDDTDLAVEPRWSAVN